MKTNNVVLEKSYAFAIKVVKTHLYLSGTKKEYTLSKQFLKSGTSIGANIEEAQGGQSRRDFIAKTQIAYKEARETHFWLRLLKDTQFLDESLSKDLLSDCEELLRIIGTILKSSKNS
jgi:four helix bundle protein